MLPFRLLSELLHRAISRSPQEGASGCTTVDSKGAFRGCFQCWCSVARYCIVYNNIYPDVYSRCCVHGALSRNNVSVYVYAYPVAHARTRVLRECYVHTLSRSRIDRKSGVLALENPVHRGQDYDGGRNHATHARTCVRARSPRGTLTKCVYACVVGARNTCNNTRCRRAFT